jgi:UDP-N-acetylmuramate--alanine ligase
MSNEKPRVHLIGIGGSGLSAIARLLLESGYSVSGSDRSLSPLAQELAQAGARVFEGHHPDNIRGADLVVRSSAVTDDNVEVQAAQAAGVPVLKRAQFLGQLMEGQKCVAVAGTHGKTTITAMIAWLLSRLGQDPSYIIGGTSKNLGGNAHAGSGPMFVIEADEYDRMFLGLNPDLIVISYLEHDHPDCFPTAEVYLQAFGDFVARLRPQGTLLVSADNAAAARLAESAPSGTRAFRYGTSATADYRLENLAPNAQGGFDYDAVFYPSSGPARKLAQVSLRVPGEHNARNSLAALAALHQSLPGEANDTHLQAAAQALAEFSGTGRRFEVRGEVGGITVVDDYAHHPTEVRATLAAARARFGERRVWVVWQPHTFSRTRSLAGAFAESFADADQVIVTEVYAAREKAEDFDHFSAAQVVAKMTHPSARFIPTLAEVSDELIRQLQPGDAMLVLSAGDADKICTQVLAGLRERNQDHA